MNAILKAVGTWGFGSRVIFLSKSCQDASTGATRGFFSRPYWKFHQLLLRFATEVQSTFQIAARSSFYLCIMKFPPNIIYDLLIGSHSIFSIFFQNNISLKNPLHNNLQHTGVNKSQGKDSAANKISKYQVNEVSSRFHRSDGCFTHHSLQLHPI